MRLVNISYSKRQIKVTGGLVCHNESFGLNSVGKEGTIKEFFT